MEISIVLLVIGIVLLLVERNKILKDKSKFQNNFNVLMVENEKLKTILNLQRENSDKNLEERFENISNRILKMQKEEFDKKQTENLQNLLNPFRSQITDFKTLIESTNKENKEDKGYFGKYLEDMKTINSRLSKDANDLTNALKGNSKIQGDWGENQLKDILDMAGFMEGRDYNMQCNLKGEDGENLRPDCIISLPDGKKLIVDSKVSISNYIDYMKSDDELDRKKSMNLHISSIRKHISDLSTKEYQKLLKDKSLDFVFMFIPNEHAYIEALKFDADIYDNAYKYNIAITTPSSILPILRTVKNLWNIEKQNENASRIADRAGAMYDKLYSFVSDMQSIDKGLLNARKAYDEAFSKLSTGRGNALNIASDIKKLGAKTTKDIGVDFDDETPLLESDNNLL